ncbi:nuclear cap-binding protein subunit 3 [Microdochium nivale]|nr:nuclear cap-binding protein subunit 3 [Microdochium nivale]
MDTMDLDMEMDMEVEVDLVPDEPIVPDAYHEDLAPRSPGEVAEQDPEAPAPNKVHIRGLDVLNPKELKAYVAEHFPEASFSRIEWIDDSSANLLFGNEDVAARALAALAADSETGAAVGSLPPRQLAPAKSFSQRPEVVLQVRHAVWGDRKQQGAASRSRFYLLNPEYDPEERARRRRSYRDRDGGGGGGDDRRRRQEPRTREDEPKDHFDVNLYDDNEAALATRGGDEQNSRRRRSYTSNSDDGGGRRARRESPPRRENIGKELFPLGGGGGERTRRNNGASRDRSRSPVRSDRDGDRDMTDGGFASDGSGAAASSRNRDRARAVKSHMQRSNRAAVGRELFPAAGAKGDSSSGRLGDKVEDAAELLARGITLPLMDGSNDVAPSSTSSKSQSRRLEDRISAPGQGGGRLAGRTSALSSGGGPGPAFNIRGVASKESSDQGFAIKGMGKSAKELFPDKFGGGGTSGNENKELFGSSNSRGDEPRARNRKKAGDLFD